MLKEPLVYIILVNYNGFEDTKECIASLKKIDYKNYKIILVDNASVEKANLNFDGVITIKSKVNLGFAGGNNLGVKKALKDKADYILLLNNDTTVEKDFLSELVKTAMKDNKIGVVGGKINYFDEKDKIWYAGGKVNSFTARTRHIGVNEIDKGEYDKESETEYVTGCMMLVPAKVIEDVGMMEEDYFLYYEETDWNMKIKNGGYKIVYNPKAKIYHKISSSTQKISDIVSYYYDRNSYYFIMRNFGTKNKMFMFCYMRTRLLMKFAREILRNNSVRKKIVINSYKSIRKEAMGKYEA
ncbi:glycosyltransferase family 2 protein [uncultured Clostridium sp.]|uniref:glycosyltransferase family 2 protein n=1 Tax=uncultured Clostridium sp. TaxID=59620 RepID=UPI002632D1B5|nr:glycosyltransferase family 2 protein [uncultured Clostridium sp.]